MKEALRGASAAAPPDPPPPDQLCGRDRILRHHFSYFRVLLVVMLLRPDPAAHQVIPDRVGQSEVVIPLGGHIAIFHQREVKMTVKICFQVRDVFKSGEPPHGDLLPFFLVRQRLCHVSRQTAAPV